MKNSNLRFFPLFIHGFILVFMGILISQTVIAQDPIKITVSVIPPYPNYADEVIEMGDQTIITIQNTDLNTGYSLKLGVELSGDNGVIVRSKENAMPNQSMDILAGETVILTGDEMSSFYNNYTEGDFDFIGITKADIINDQQLPDGAYTVCVRAYDYNTSIPLSATSPLGCTPPFTVIAVDPPIITYPQDQMQLTVLEPQLLSINWIPVSVTLADLRYRLEMVDLTDMPINVYDAFETGDFLFFYEEDIFANTFLYGMESPLLTEGHEYAIRVRAYRLDGLLNVSNNGYSDVVTFTYGEPTSGDGDETNNGVDNGVGDGGDGDGDIIFTPTSLPDQNMNCGESCNFNLTGNETAISQKPQVGSILQIGNFQLKISAIQGSGTFSGSGVIQATGYIPVGIKVSFDNVQVDNQGRVIAGKAKAEIRSGSWIDETWADINTASKNIHVNPNDYGGDFQAATDPQYYIDYVSAQYQNVGTTIPISIGAANNSLQIVGMNFFPDRASYNLSYILKLADDPSGERYLHFMTKDLCISPGGMALTADEARLELVKSFRYTFDNSTQLIFQPAGLGSDGTYLSFDCDGFAGIHAQGEARFNPDVIKPVTADGDVIQGDTVAASFITNFVTWADWVATVSFDTDDNNPNSTSESLFMYTELDDYIIKVQNAFIDHSINMNPETMAFPDNYSNNSGPDWQGVYLKTITVDMPKWVKAYDDADERVRLTGSDLIIDSQGLTGVIHASNVLSSKEGAMGKWPVTIHSLQIKIEQNSLAQAFFMGDLKIPVIEEPFNYTADLQFLQNSTKHTFTFSPIEEYNFSTWFATATLDDNSKLTVTTTSTKAFIEADLNATISFAPAIGDVDKMSLTDIKLEHLVIRSEKDPSYIEIGSIETGVSAQSLAIAGFGIILNNLDWVEDAAENTGLDIGVGLSLAGDTKFISGDTQLFIKNKFIDNTDSLTVTFNGTEIKAIHLAVETGAVNLDGTIQFFRDDDKFGNGFDGDLTLTFINSITINGKVMFGNKVTNGNTLHYFYAHAMINLPNSPMPLATPLDLYGFGGGVYYNMSLNTEFPNPAAAGGLDVDPHEVFNIEEGILGLQASAIIGLTPSSRTFNADVTLTAEVNMNSGGLNLVAFTGAGYIMQKINEPEKDQAMVTATVAISYDFPAKTFEAKFGVNGQIPKENTLLTVDGEIEFYRSPTLWYFKAGIPTKTLNTTLDLGLFGIEAHAYFMTGQELPPPVLPPKVEKFFHFNSSMANNTQNGLGIGFMAGVHLDVDVEFNLFSGTGIHIWAAAGVDIAVLNYFAATCNGSEDFGVNKWYAQGRGYIAGSFSLDILSASIASLELGVIVEGAFPNPTGVRGNVKAKIEFLIVDYDVDEDFQFGTFCDIQPMANAESLIDHKEKELDKLALVGIVTPASAEPGVSTTVQPTIEWFFENGDFKRFTYGDGTGGLIYKLYRINNNFQWQMKSESDTWADVQYSSERDVDTKITTYKAVNANGNPSLLHGSADYKIIAKSSIEYFDGDAQYYGTPNGNGNWIAATYYEGDNQGDPIIETVTHPFKTTTSLTEIEEMFVDYTLPYPRQRFYPYGYLSTAKIKFNVEQEPKFQDFESCGFQVHAEFTPTANPGTVDRVEVSRANLMQATFDMASLNPETIYKLQIVAERRTTQNDIISSAGSACGITDGVAMSNLMTDYGLSTNLGNFQGSVNQLNLGPSIPNYFGNNSNSTPSDSITQRKILYTIYFRTSKYETPQQKLNSISVDEVSPVADMVYFNSTIMTVKDVYVKLNCGEGFDKYDLFGHDYQTSETMEYFRPYGPSCNTGGMETGVQNWFSNTCFELYGYGSNPSGGGTMQYNGNGGLPGAIQIAQNLADGQPGIWRVDYRSDAANYTGVKYIKPLLSDAEVGLAEPVSSGTYTPSTIPLIGVGEVGGNGLAGIGNNSSSGSSGSSSSGSSNTGSGTYGFGYGGYGISGNSGNNTIDATNLQDNNTSGTGAALINFGGEPELELLYMPDRKAYNMRVFLMNHYSFYHFNPSFPFVHPPTGTYPLRIRFTNPADKDNPDAANPDLKELNITIPFQP